MIQDYHLFFALCPRHDPHAIGSGYELYARIENVHLTHEPPSPTLLSRARRRARNLFLRKRGGTEQP